MTRVKRFPHALTIILDYAKMGYSIKTCSILNVKGIANTFFIALACPAGLEIDFKKVSK
jgi:hypothetical protein